MLFRSGLSSGNVVDAPPVVTKIQEFANEGVGGDRVVRSVVADPQRAVAPVGNEVRRPAVRGRGSPHATTRAHDVGMIIDGEHSTERVSDSCCRLRRALATAGV